MSEKPADIEDIAMLRERLVSVTSVVITLINWMAQSAVSPISTSEATLLIEELSMKVLR